MRVVLVRLRVCDSGFEKAGSLDPGCDLVVSAADGVVRVPAEGAVAAGVSSVVDVVRTVRRRAAVRVGAGSDGVGTLPQFGRDFEGGGGPARST